MRDVIQVTLPRGLQVPDPAVQNQKPPGREQRSAIIYGSIRLEPSVDLGSFAAAFVGCLSPRAVAASAQPKEQIIFFMEERFRMQYFLGVDAGGTKAEFALGDDARELARVRVGTIKRMKANAETTEANLVEALRQLESATGVSPRSIT